MHASEIRSRFLQYFARQSHATRSSSTHVPGDDPTLLLTNAGMVQFKKVFLGQKLAPDGNRRATTSQKCVRAGGKHNDLEQVGHTARHHSVFAAAAAVVTCFVCTLVFLLRGSLSGELPTFWPRNDLSGAVSSVPILGQLLLSGVDES